MNKIRLMKVRSLRFGVTALLLLVASAEVNAYDFYAINDDGVSIYYNILSEEDKTVEVTYLYYNSTSNSEAYSGAVSIPETATYNGSTYTVTEIGDRAFSWCKCLTSVTIPESVTTIGSYVFRGCTGLTQFEVAKVNEYYCAKDGVLYSKDMTTLVTFPLASPLLPSFEIPNSVTSIGSSAFESCTGLTIVTIPNSVIEIGGDAFMNCTGLTSVSIGNSVNSIGDNAFDGCTGLTSITIGESVAEIGTEAFFNCSGLTQVTIPNSVTSIGDGAFYRCAGLTEVSIPNSVIEIDENAFAYCKSLTEVTIGKGVTTIGNGAFLDCTSLTEVAIPKSVTTIGMGVFARTGVIRCEVEKGNKQYCTKKGVLFSKDKKKLIAFPPASLMTSYKIPKGVIEIYGGAFMFCSNLTEVTIPKSVTAIGEAAFYGCSDLTEVVIGKSVTHIGDKAFVECTTLKKVTSLNPEPPTCDNYVFGRTDDSYCVLYVPEGSKAEYSMAEEWRDFDEIREMEPSVKEGTITIIVLAACALLLVAVVILLVVIIKLFRKTKQQEATNT